MVDEVLQTRRTSTEQLLWILDLCGKSIELTQGAANTAVLGYDIWTRFFEQVVEVCTLLREILWWPIVETVVFPAIAGNITLIIPYAAIGLMDDRGRSRI